MGDRCYMTIYCRPQDVPRFETLGFLRQNESDCPYAEMVDEQANYGHYGELPTDIPFHGFHNAGGDYGAMEVACDGEYAVEWETGHTSGYVFHADPNGAEEWPKELANFNHFQEVNRRATTLVDPPQSSLP